MLVSVSEVKCEIRSITNLSTMAALTTVENEIPDFIDIVKKKQIIMQKHQKWNKNISLLPIIINLLIISFLDANIAERR